MSKISFPIENYNYELWNLLNNNRQVQWLNAYYFVCFQFTIMVQSIHLHDVFCWFSTGPCFMKAKKKQYDVLTTRNPPFKGTYDRKYMKKEMIVLNDTWVHALPYSVITIKSLQLTAPKGIDSVDKWENYVECAFNH